MPAGMPLKCLQKQSIVCRMSSFYQGLFPQCLMVVGVEAMRAAALRKQSLGPKPLPAVSYGD